MRKYNYLIYYKIYALGEGPIYADGDWFISLNQPIRKEDVSWASQEILEKGVTITDVKIVIANIMQLADSEEK